MHRLYIYSKSPSLESVSSLPCHTYMYCNWGLCFYGPIHRRLNLSLALFKCFYMYLIQLIYFVLEDWRNSGSALVYDFYMYVKFCHANKKTEKHTKHRNNSSYMYMYNGQSLPLNFGHQTSIG